MAGKLPQEFESFARVFPILGWLPRYEPAWLRPDVIAGLTLWGILVPEAIAYAAMAGAPPEAGLYTLLGSLVVYSILGTTRQAASAPTSRVLNHDGRSSRAISNNRSQRISRITRLTRSVGRHHFAAVRFHAVGFCHRVHFSFRNDRLHFRLGDPYRREPGSEAFWIA